MLVEAQVTTPQPPRVAAIVRWTWPATTRLTCGERASSSAERRAVGVREADLVEPREADEDRRVVHGDDRRRLAVLVELRREPVDVERAVVAAVRSRCRR